MLLVIGYGNVLRQDDGAGPALAARLSDALAARGAAARLVLTHQLVPELALDVMAGDVAAVLFVDARVAADAGDTAVRVEPVPTDVAPSPSLGHHTGPAVVLAYCAALGSPIPPAWLVTAPGFAFDFGEGLSTAASAALDTALSAAHGPVAALLDRLARA
jgi:hydrogenase maturation protease